MLDEFKVECKKNKVKKEEEKKLIAEKSKDFEIKKKAGLKVLKT